MKIPLCQNSSIFPLGLHKTRVFLEIKKEKLASTNGQRYQTDVWHKVQYSKSVYGKTYIYFIQYIDSFIQPFCLMQFSPSSFSWLFESLYLSTSHGPYAEKADFFPQKLDSSCLTPPSPSTLLPPFPSFCLSAVKGNSQAPTNWSSTKQQNENLHISGYASVHYYNVKYTKIYINACPKHDVVVHAITPRQHTTVASLCIY